VPSGGACNNGTNCCVFAESCVGGKCQ
jgi:hypothetical protein